MKEVRHPFRDLAQCFWPQVRPHSRRLSLSFFLSFVAVAASLLAPWPLKLLIDSVLGDTPFPVASVPWAALEPEALVGLLAVGYLAVACVRSLASAAQRLVDAGVREALGIEVRERLLSHLLRLSPAHAARRLSGEVVHHLVTDAQIFVRWVAKTLPLTIQHLASVVAALVATLLISTWVAAIGLLAAIALTGLARSYARRLGDAARGKRRVEGALAGVAQEVVRGLPAHQAMGDLGAVRERFLRAAEEAQGAGVAETRVALSMERSLQVAHAAVLALVTAAGGLMVLRGSLTVGDLTVCLSYVTLLLKPVEKVNELSSSLARGAAAGERLLELLALEPHVPDGNREPRDPVAGCLEVRDVWFRHPEADRADAVVLRGVDACFRPRELTVVCGASGEGKSSLLQLLVRAFDPDRGQILLDGRPIRELRLASLRSQITFIPQTPHLFSGTLREALAHGIDEPDDRALASALRRVALESFVGSLPCGLDTPIGEDAVDLSGGQRQRISLAHALLLDRPIVLLDEPTSNVDSEIEQVLHEAITALAADRTCVVVTHSERLIRIADVVYRLKEGELRREESPRRPPPHRSESQ